MRFNVLGVSLALVASFCMAKANAEDLSVAVVDGSKNAVVGAIVSLMPVSDTIVLPKTEKTASIKQQNVMFSPFILPVQTGTLVTFPNMDKIRHHVYSFSSAKTFELKLYGQDETQQVLFDKKGVAALGCNIHDNMLAYIYVTDDPLFRVADQSGKASFSDLPVGDYEIHIWHPDQQKSMEGYAHAISLPEGGAKALELVFEMKSRRHTQQQPVENEY
ncbi:cupredoxin domain-containing protein [Kordiimonas pumila]|uniref:Methylamine utilization protein n=1 Tax=Kordiimonas pumila TaxID=2161677 RepID=A0ABV7D3E8_9PROT|nr:methylamine utilization protein [Kordiimonas pumila]